MPVPGYPTPPESNNHGPNEPAHCLAFRAEHGDCPISPACSGSASLAALGGPSPQLPQLCLLVGYHNRMSRGVRQVTATSEMKMFERLSRASLISRMSAPMVCFWRTSASACEQTRQCLAQMSSRDAAARANIAGLNSLCARPFQRRRPACLRQCSAAASLGVCLSAVTAPPAAARHPATHVSAARRRVWLLCPLLQGYWPATRGGVTLGGAPTAHNRYNSSHGAAWTGE